jgi:peptidoglycan/LPS O-acetylase OafA/YrhL
LLTVADISVGTSIAVVIGVILSGVISAVVVMRSMGPSDSADGEQRRVALDNRNFALRRIASIYSPISFVVFFVALVAGDATFVVLSAINAAVGVMALVLARRHPRQ